MLKRLIAGFLMLIMPGLCWAGQVSLIDLIETLEVPFKQGTAKEERIRDFSAAFSQESHISSIDRVQRGKGKVRFRFVPASGDVNSQAQFRWDYTEPEVQEIISDGQMMWVYLPDNRQVIASEIQSMAEQQGENPVTFLSGLDNLSHNFKIDWPEGQSDESGHYWLHLMPVKPSSLIDEMDVLVNGKAVSDWRLSRKTGDNFPIVATRVTDSQGNRTVIRFAEVRINNGFDSKPFIFDKPEDVELVRPEQMSF